MSSQAPKSAKLSPGERSKIVELLHVRFGGNLAPGEVFTFDGELSHSEVNLSVRLSDFEESDVLLIEGHIDLELNEIQDPSEAKTSLLDTLDELLGGYFEEERFLRMVDDWQEYINIDGHTVMLRGSRRNLKLERMADELLAADDARREQ